MESIEQMITRLCPEGVEYVKLGEIGTQFNGLSGASNKWKDIGNCRFIDYMNAYKNISIDVTNLPYATVQNIGKQIELRKGDVLFTAASETPDECALSAAIERDLPKGVFMDDHLFGIRINDDSKEKVMPGYLKYLFRSSGIRSEVNKSVRGVTRFYISKKDFMSLSIPLPPMEIQVRIVEVLDKMTTLTAELEAELEARKQQYEYYRNNLFKFKEGECEWKKIGEIAYYPKVRIKSEMLTVNTYVGVESLVKNKGGKTISSSVPEGVAIEFLPQDILIGNIRPYLKKIWLSDCQGGTNGDVVCIRVLDSKEIMPKYLYYILASDAFFDYNNSHAKGGKMPRGDKNVILGYEVPIPSMEEQSRIVSILGRFEALTTDLQKGLPAEINARRQQYEHYRNRLLAFERR